MGSPEEKILDFICEAHFDELPEKTVLAAKKLILDSVGVAMAAWKTQGSQAVLKQVKAWGGSPEASILVDGRKVPAPWAAFANGVLAHSRDYDDDYEPVGIHCSASVVPAAMAAAQLRGGCTGKEFLTGVTLGVDLMCRLGDSLKPAYGWHQTAIYGAIGATAAAGKILDLNRTELQNAFGIMHCSIPGGNKQGRKEGALTKRLQPAYAAQCAVMAVCLARAGITGCLEFISGDYGFWSLYGMRGLPKPDERELAENVLLRDLGIRYRIDELSLKPYPCCRYAHPAIDGALQFRADHGLDAEDIREVTVSVSKVCYERVGAPFRIRGNPQVDAQFSIPYTMALALKLGRVTMADLETPAILNRRQIIELAEKINVKVDPALEGKVPVRIEVKTSEKTLNRIVNVVKGSPEAPLTGNEIKDKFLDCVCYSREYDASWGDRLYEQIMCIDEISSIDELVCLKSIQK